MAGRASWLGNNISPQYLPAPLFNVAPLVGQHCLMGNASVLLLTTASFTRDNFLVLYKDAWLPDLVPVLQFDTLLGTRQLPSLATSLVQLWPLSPQQGKRHCHWCCLAVTTTVATTNAWSTAIDSPLAMPDIAVAALLTTAQSTLSSSTSTPTTI